MVIHSDQNLDFEFSIYDIQLALSRENIATLPRIERKKWLNAMLQIYLSMQTFAIALNYNCEIHIL